MNKKITVIGAGISGLMAAYYLAKDGHKVTILEAERYAAMRTSFANGGQVSVSNSEVWTTWSNVKKGIKWIFQKDAPLLIRPSLELAKISWLLKFLKNTFLNVYGHNTAKTIELGLLSRTLYKKILEEENLEFDQSFTGILHFYKNPDYFENAKSVQDLYEANGCEWSILENTDIAKLEPALNSYGIVGGAYTAADWTGDIHKFCNQLADILQDKYGVKIYYNVQVNDLEPYLENNDAIVISNGVGSTKLAKSIGDSIDVYPVKGYSITINNVDPTLLPKVSLLDDEAKIVTSTLGNRFRVAGTAELAGENYDIRRDRIEPLLKWVRDNFPLIDCRNYTSYACLRPMTPDMMPIVKCSTVNPKVYYHTGHGHLGWTLSPATALRLSRMLRN